MNKDSHNLKAAQEAVDNSNLRNLRDVINEVRGKINDEYYASPVSTPMANSQKLSHDIA